MRLILGSSSPHRRAILERNGFEFEVVSPDLDEGGIRSEDPRQRPLLVARAKMAALIGQIQGPAVILAADQVVLAEGRLREKPRDVAEARAWLRSAHLHLHQTVTAVVAMNTQASARAEGVDVAAISFRQMPDSIIEELVALGEILQCAGGFSCEHPLVQPYVLEFQGEMESLIGLPMGLTRKLLNEVGWR